MHYITKSITLFVFCMGLAACSGSAVSIPTPEPTIVPTATEQNAEELTPTVTTSPQPTLTPTSIPCTAEAGTIIESTLASALIEGDVAYRIYLPPCYGQYDGAYPVIYLFHGFGAGMDDAMWDTIGIDEAATIGYLNEQLPPLIIVMPNGNDAQHDLDTGVYDRVVVEELIPTIDNTYCTWPEPEARAIGGLSRGGWWAYSVAFQYPEMFSRVGGHSGFFYEGDFPENNPYNLAATAPNIEGLQMYLDYGADDTVVNDLVEDFDAQLRARGLEPTFLLNPSGGHTNAYWAEQSSNYLAWYTADWPTSIDDYPTCEEPSP